jgi:hypothetical protein
VRENEDASAWIAHELATLDQLSGSEGALVGTAPLISLSKKRLVALVDEVLSFTWAFGPPMEMKDMLLRFTDSK